MIQSCVLVPFTLETKYRGFWWQAIILVMIRFGRLEVLSLQLEDKAEERGGSVMPLVLQVYFQDHTGSLKDPNIDTWSEILNYHSDFHTWSTFLICHLLLISPSPNLRINDPRWQLSQSVNTMCIIFESARVAGSLFSMVTPYRWEIVFLVTDQMSIPLCFNRLFLRRWGVVNIRLPWHLEICRVILEISH